MLKVQINDNDNDEIWKLGLMIIINGCWKCELIIMIMMRFWRFGLKILINNNK